MVAVICLSLSESFGWYASSNAEYRKYGNGDCSWSLFHLPLFRYFTQHFKRLDERLEEKLNSILGRSV